MIDFYNEFQSYATKHMGISQMQFENWNTLQGTLYNSVQVSGSMTPYILEEREMRVTQN